MHRSCLNVRPESRCGSKGGKSRHGDHGAPRRRTEAVSRAQAREQGLPSPCVSVVLRDLRGENPSGARNTGERSGRALRQPHPFRARAGVVLSLLYGLLFASAAPADTIRLGAILPLTGPAAHIGAAQVQGLRLAIEEANARGGVRGHGIVLVAEDSAADPGKAIAAFRALTVAPRVEVIFVSHSVPALAVAPLSARHAVLLVNAGAQADRLGVASPYLLNTLPPVAAETAVLVRHLRAEGKKTAVILHDNTAAGLSGRDDFADLFTQAGGTILAQEQSLFGQTEVGEELDRLAAAKPDVMLVSLTAGIPGVARWHGQRGLRFTVAGTGFFRDPALIAEPSAEGFVWAGARAAPAFERTSGVPLSFTARQHHTAARMVLKALEDVLATGRPVTGTAARDAMLTRGEFRNLTTGRTGNTAAAPIDLHVMRGGAAIIVTKAE